MTTGAEGRRGACGSAISSRRGFIAAGVRCLGSTSVAGAAGRTVGLWTFSRWPRDAGGATETRRSKAHGPEGPRREASVTDVPREYLVILEPGLAEQARTKVEAVAVVTQVLRPRLLLIRADAQAEERVARIA